MHLPTCPTSAFCSGRDRQGDGAREMRNRHLLSIVGRHDHPSLERLDDDLVCCLLRQTIEDLEAIRCAAAGNDKIETCRNCGMDVTPMLVHVTAHLPRR
jgi:hypothetical protein